ncbi:winged helix-turn-helix transcriptional regulator [Pedobacter panaciterrae]
MERLAYKELPPRVEYKLSEKGLAKTQMVDLMTFLLFRINELTQS